MAASGVIRIQVPDEAGHPVTMRMCPRPGGWTVEIECGAHQVRIPLADQGLPAIVEGLRDLIATVGSGGSNVGVTDLIHGAWLGEPGEA